MPHYNFYPELYLSIMYEKVISEDKIFDKKGGFAGDITTRG
jgi:hypothetical protein